MSTQTPGLPRWPRRSPRRACGLTLVELVLAIAIVAILAALAYPAYSEQVERSRRAKAISDIGNIQLLISRYESSQGELPESLTDIDPKGFTDPWSRPYVYTNLGAKGARGSARKDRRLNPINSDYDLFSVGKDGVYKPQISQKDSLDDIIRARDGAFIGPAAEFGN